MLLRTALSIDCLGAEKKDDGIGPTTFTLATSPTNHQLPFTATLTVFAPTAYANTYKHHRQHQETEDNERQNGCTHADEWRRECEQHTGTDWTHDERNGTARDSDKPPTNERRVSAPTDEKRNGNVGDGEARRARNREEHGSHLALADDERCARWTPDSELTHEPRADHCTQCSNNAVSHVSEPPRSAPLPARVPAEPVVSRPSRAPASADPPHDALSPTNHVSELSRSVPSQACAPAEPNANDLAATLAMLARLPLNDDECTTAVRAILGTATAPNPDSADHRDDEADNLIEPGDLDDPSAAGRVRRPPNWGKKRPPKNDEPPTPPTIRFSATGDPPYGDAMRVILAWLSTTTQRSIKGMAGRIRSLKRTYRFPQRLLNHIDRMANDDTEPPEL